MSTLRAAAPAAACLLAVLLAACPSPTGTSLKTVTLHSQSNLDGTVTWMGGTDYYLSFAGDSSYIGEDNEGSERGCARMIVSFDLSSLPAGAAVQSATLRLYQSNISSGDSYVALDEVLVSNVDYLATTAAAELFGTRTTGYDIGIGPLSVSFVPNVWHEIDVTESAVAEFTERQTGRLQYRIQHEYENNTDAQEDFDGWTTGDSPVNKPELVIVYRE